MCCLTQNAPRPANRTFAMGREADLSRYHPRSGRMRPPGTRGAHLRARRGNDRQSAAATGAFAAAAQGRRSSGDRPRGACGSTSVGLLGVADATPRRATAGSQPATGSLSVARPAYSSPSGPVRVRPVVARVYPSGRRGVKGEGVGGNNNGTATNGAGGLELTFEGPQAGQASPG